MHLLKAIRVWSAVGVASLLLGCETTAESEYVPTKVIVREPAAVQISPGLIVAQVEPTTVAPVQTKAEPTPAPTNSPSVDQAKLEEQAAQLQNAATNQTPVIKEELPLVLPENLKISEATGKIIKLAQGGVDETVMIAFVQKAEGKFELEADEIVYLSDLGVSSPVLTAMLKHDGDDPGKAEALTAAPNTEATQITPLNPGQGQAAIEVTTNYVPSEVAPPAQTVIVQQPAPAVIIQQQPDVQYFYSSLAPYGSWLYVTDYGWCWQPTVAVADRGWRPYGHRGNWVWSTSGWYWRSDYSWGWAPFHYGRWHLAGSRGWCWVPDRVWGPAWVSWRNTSDYCGWAPLPPAARYEPGFGFSYFGSRVGVSFGFGLSSSAYCFAPIGRFHDRRVWDHCIPGYRANHIYSRSVVNNRYDWDRNHHVVNNGVPRERVERAINRDLRPVQIRDLPERETSGRAGLRERIERSGRDEVIYTPRTPRGDARPTNPTVAESPRVGNQGRLDRANNSVATPSSVAPGAARGTRPERRPVNRQEVNAIPAPAPVQPESPRVSRNRESRPPITTTPAPVVTPNTTPTPATPITPAPGASTSPRVNRRESPLRDSPAPGVTVPSREIGRRDLNNSITPTRPAPVVTTPVTPPSQITQPTPRISRPVPQVSSPAPTSVAPPVSTPNVRAERPRVTPLAPRIESAQPRIVSPPPQIVSPSPRIVSPPPSQTPRVPRNESFRAPAPSPAPSFSAPPQSAGRVSRNEARPAPSAPPPSAAPAQNPGSPGNSAGRGRSERGERR